MLKLFPDNRIHEIDDDIGEDYGDFCTGFFVEKVLSDIHTHDETALVVLYSRGGIKRFELGLEMFTRNSLSRALIQKGLEYVDTEDFTAAALEYAMKSKSDAPMINSYSKLGWYTLDGQLVYFCDQIVSESKNDFNAVCKDKERLQALGSFDAWREGLLPFLSRPEVILALIIGASATVIPLLKESGLFSETPIFALIGRSSSYKTTMLKLMASIYGKPSIGDGVIDTMTDTMGYFFENLGNKQGFLHAVDDISANHGHDFSDDIYTISMGKSRGRLAPDGSKKKIKTWSTTVVYTGETSIFEQTNQNLGLYSRLVEFTHEWLTPEDDVNGFYEVINNNYGVALKPLIQYLFTLSQEDLRELYDGAFEVVNQVLLPTDGVSRRIVQRLAILILTLLIINDAWNLELQIPSILNLLKESYVSNLPPTDPIDEGFQRIKELISSNSRYFPQNLEKDNSSHDAWGVYGSFKYRPCLWVSEGNMKKIVEDSKLGNVKSVQKELADRGFLVRDSGDHYVFEKTVGRFKHRCYGIYCDDIKSTVPKKSATIDHEAQRKRMQNLLEEKN